MMNVRSDTMNRTSTMKRVRRTRYLPTRTGWAERERER
jgi:hypothetical protein